MKKKILASISGGETSGMMGYIIKNMYDLTPVMVYKNKGKPLYTKWVNDEVEIIFVFMNTSQEDNRTLDFVNKLSLLFDLKITWLEASINPIKGKGIGHNIVKYQTAKRDGSIFENHIAKYGLPSSKAPHCTRDLKEGCCVSFQKEVGFEKCIIAIGYRSDEPKRVNFIKAERKNQWYPLFEKRVNKQMVKSFWQSQSFKLGLKEHEGNCKLCFKKSKRKLLLQILEHPDYIQWYIDMQTKYPLDTKEKPVVMFRGRESIFDLIEESKQFNTQSEFDFELDEQEDCAESCEVFANDY